MSGVGFGDIAGKLHMLQIECTRCARKGRYSVAKLLAHDEHLCGDSVSA